MAQRITFMTLGANDLKVSTEFYENRFGWKRSEMSNGDMVLYQLNGYT